jgi:hypothetical protein
MSSERASNLGIVFNLTSNNATTHVRDILLYLIVSADAICVRRDARTPRQKESTIFNPFSPKICSFAVGLLASWQDGTEAIVRFISLGVLCLQ